MNIAKTLFAAIALMIGVNQMEAFAQQEAHVSTVKPLEESVSFELVMSMIETNQEVLKAAQVLLRNAENLTGDLGKAVTYHKASKYLYGKKKFKMAAEFAKASREKAFKFLRANGGEIEKPWEFTNEEITAAAGSLSEEKMDQLIIENSESENPILSDQDVLKQGVPVYFQDKDSSVDMSK